MSIFGWIICAILVVSSSFCGLWSALYSMEAIEEVNQFLPKDKQFPTIFINFVYFEFRREYQRLCPRGKLLKQSERAAGLMFLLFLFALAAGQIFHLSIPT